MRSYLIVGSALVLGIALPVVVASQGLALGEADMTGQELSPVLSRTLSPEDAKETAMRQAYFRNIGVLMTQAAAANKVGDMVTESKLSSLAYGYYLRASSHERVKYLPLPFMPQSLHINAITHEGQQRTYWCGPATVSMLVKAKGKTVSQKQAAAKLGTTTNGTGWQPGSRGPMVKVLTRYTAHKYMAYAVNDYSRNSQLAYKGALVTTIGNRVGLAVNTVRYVGSSVNLVGHPNRTIYHWLAVRGYQKGGNITNYVDPAAGSVLGWTGVPKYSAYSSASLVRLMAERGYVAS